MNAQFQTYKINQFITDNWNDNYDAKIRSFRNLNEQILDYHTNTIKNKTSDNAGYKTQRAIAKENPLYEIHTTNGNFILFKLGVFPTEYKKYVQTGMDGTFNTTDEGILTLKNDAYAKMKKHPIIDELCFSLSYFGTKEDVMNSLICLNDDTTYKNGIIDQEQVNELLNKPCQAFVDMTLRLCFQSPDLSLMMFNE